MTAVGTRRADPRIQARRDKVARSEGRKRFLIVGGLTALASVALGAIALSNSSLLDIESVVVEGAVRADPAQVVTAARIVPGEPLVEIDLEASTAAVRLVPWVAEASVDRKLDGSVIITIVERQGVVAVPTGSRLAVIDRTGQQLEVVDHLPDGYVPVAGVEASGVPGQPVGDDVHDVVAVVESLTPTVREATVEVNHLDGGVWLILADGGRARIGDSRDLQAKLVALETIMARVDLACLAVIDVRVPEAPTVSRERSASANEEPLQEPAEC